MKLVRIAAAICWIWVIGGNILSISFQNAQNFKEFVLFPWWFCALPLVVVAGAWFRPVPPPRGRVEMAIDRIFGQGCWRQFLATLRPQLMFATMAFSIVAANLVRGLVAGTYVLPIPLVGFFACGGIAFVIAFLIRQSRERA